MSVDEYRKPRRGNRAVKLIVFIALLVLLAAGGVFAWKFMFSGDKKTDEQTKTYDEKISRLVVEGNSGNVDVVAGEGDAVKVKTELEWRGDNKPGTSQDVNGETLKVAETGCDGIDLFGLVGCEVTMVIEVPADVELDAKVDSGDLTAVGITGNQKLDCDSGNITVEGSGKKLTVSADSGDLTGRDLNATDVNAKVDSGNVDLSFSKAPKKIKADADSGDLTLSVPDDGEAYKVKTTVDSGDKTVDIKTDKASARKIDATVDSGDVTINYA